MDCTETSCVQDIQLLKQRFHEKLYELQNNTDTLQAMQKELLETRQSLYNMELELEKERAISHELRMQLKVTTSAMSELQQQQTKNQVESVQLQVKYDAMSKQYDSLMSQATAAKIQETEYRIKIQSLEENLRQKDKAKKRLEQMLNELENNNLHTISTIDHNITKLTQEHQHLMATCDTITTLNQRLQTVGLSTHAIHQRDKAKIKDLQNTLASMSITTNLARQPMINE